MVPKLEAYVHVDEFCRWRKHHENEVVGPREPLYLPLSFSTFYSAFPLQQTGIIKRFRV
jgi:hypothetical protein